MPPAGFEPVILTNEKPQTYVLDRAATGSDFIKVLLCATPDKKGKEYSLLESVVPTTTTATWETA